MQAFRVDFISDFKEADRYSVILTTNIEKHYSHITSDQSFHINFAFRELLNNAVEHGNSCNPDKKVICTVFGTESRITIVVEDEGQGFHLLERPNPQDKQTDKTILKTRQRGLWLRQQLGFELFVEKSKVITYYDLEVLKCK